MAFETLTGIVLRYTDYKENDRILTVLTRERGLITLSARGVRKKSGAGSSAVKDAYCYGEFVIYERNGHEQVSTSTVLEAFYPIREDYDRLVSAAQAARLAERLAADRMGDELFSILYHTLSFLAYGEANCRDLLLVCAAKFLAVSGYEPSITRCACCGEGVTGEKRIAFSSRQGGSLCPRCAQDEPTFSASALEALRRMLLLSPEEMDRVRLSEAVRAELDRLIFDYAEYVLEQPVRLKTKR